MASPTFFRWAGGALLVGSLVFAISIVILLFVPGPLGPSGPPAVWDAWLGAISGLVWIIGLPALYAVQSKRADMNGLLGLIALFVGILLLAVVLNVIPAIMFANYVPSGPVPQPPLFVSTILVLGSLFLIVGSLLFGIAVLRTGVFASWTVWALIVLSIISTLLHFLSFATAILIGDILAIPYVLLFTWYGYKLAFQTSAFVEGTAETSGMSGPSTVS